MNYVFENISIEDQNKILEDAGSNERIKRFLLMRGGHFENNPNLEWAIDRASDSYIFVAPKLAMVQEYQYCFFYAGVMYIICFDSLARSVIYFDGKSPVSHPLSEEMKSAIREALWVHGVCGRPVEALFGDEV